MRQFFNNFYKRKECLITFGSDLPATTEPAAKTMNHKKEKGHPPQNNLNIVHWSIQLKKNGIQQKIIRSEHVFGVPLH